MDLPEAVNGNAPSMIRYIACPFFGGLFGLIWYGTAATIAEFWVMPKVDPYTFTYGQQAILISWPTSVIMGLFAGTAIAPTLDRHFQFAARLLLTLFVLSSLWACLIWSVNDPSGICTSRYVQFYPLFVFAFLLLLMASFLFRYSHSWKEPATKSKP